jgi:hypothetical protein
MKISVAHEWARIRHVCGQKYANTYTESEFAHQPEQYNLTEVPLQAQVKNG